MANIEKGKEPDQQKTGNDFSLVSGKKGQLSLIMIDQYRQQKAQGRGSLS